MNKITVLFLAAAPDDEARIHVNTEAREIANMIRSSLHRENFNLVQSPAVRIEDLEQELLEHRPQVLHFSGHGGEDGSVILMDNDNKARPVSAEAMQTLLRQFNNTLQLVILNACHTESLAKAVAETIPCAVGMNRVIGDKAAIPFAGSFYRALGFGRSIQQAFELGVCRLMMERTGEAAVPILYSRGDVDPGQVFLGVNPGRQGPAASCLVKGHGGGGAPLSATSDFEFDVFLSYNSQNRVEVKELADTLKQFGIRPWLDESELRPGCSWPSALEQRIESIGSVAVCVGAAGFGQWQTHEIDTFLTRFVERSLPIIPVFLKDAPENSELPPFLSCLTRVDFREASPDPIKQLIWGITGKKPDTLVPTTGGTLVETMNAEWTVPEADGTDLLSAMHDLHDAIYRDFPFGEIVITLYTVRPSRHRGVGEFRYDLIYHRNLFDDAPMFGPIVPNDDRVGFVERDVTKESGEVDASEKPGGFIDREDITSCAKFKVPGARTGTTNGIVGLLFVNGRTQPIPDAVLDKIGIDEHLGQIGKIIPQIEEVRERNFNQRIGPVAANPLHMPHPISPGSISELCRSFFERFVTQSGYDHDKMALSVYLAKSGDAGSKLLWLWSNSPTSTCATLPAPDGPQRERLLIEEVAVDPNNKPLLVHYLRNKPKYRERVVRTSLRDNANVVLVVPVLSGPESPRLLGVIEVQGSEPQQFDSDDVQMLYALTQQDLAPSLARLQEAAESSLPLRNTAEYWPFPKQGLMLADDRNDVNELLALNFNPMKYLLHWKKIKELLATGQTTRPATVEVWPTMECNHDCRWCRTVVARRGRSHTKAMGKDKLLQIGEELNRIRDIHVLISGGGEPVLHPDLRDFVAALAQVEGTVGIFTNGTRPRSHRFWETFATSGRAHRFVRISLDGHDPESYCRIHFNSQGNGHRAIDKNDCLGRYAEVRKVLLDLLGLRSPRCSVAIGDTVPLHDIETLPRVVKQAETFGPDFIQIRPELMDSAVPNGHGRMRGDEVCAAVATQIDSAPRRSDFAIIHTDGERSFMNHTETRCYAMHLVPTLVPDDDPEWTRVLPCSYAINNWGTPPNLGRMRKGTSFLDFWQEMNARLKGDGANLPGLDVTITAPINPGVASCPQCRYYRLNVRLGDLAANSGKLYLIDKLVADLSQASPVDPDLRAKIEETWDRDTVDVDEAHRVFAISKELDIVPSL